MDTVTYKGNQDYLIYPHCPYDYCYSAATPVYINLSTSRGADAQCSFNCSGVLCGACKQNLSIVHNAFGVLISGLYSQYSQRLSRLLGERNPIATLVTLIWLSNAKLFRTILSAVSFTFLQYPDNTSVLLWLPDGNIHYLKGKHTPLFLAAIPVFIVAIGYVAVLLSW